MNKRAEFLKRLAGGERMADLCREYGISRKTGYKFRKRFEEDGRRGLEDRSRRPKRQPRRLDPEVERFFVELRRQHPTWGARKLRAWTRRNKPGLPLPAQSTVHEVLRRNGLPIDNYGRRRPRRAQPTPGLTEANRPNEVWTADFKGQFRTRDRRYCYPLTLCDRYSRFILGIEVLDNTRGEGARPFFERVFRDVGLPDVIRTDNGAPFASTGLAGLSKLSVWWMRLGIRPERIAPGCPQQNGRHERMHRELKRATARPAAGNLIAQQERTDDWVDLYNFDQPHESLGLEPPRSHWHRPTRTCPRQLPELRYPLHDVTKWVSSSGHVYVHKSLRFFLSCALAGQAVGLRELDDGRWLVSFMDLDLGVADPADGRFREGAHLEET